jgi:hypothetical protein
LSFVLFIEDFVLFAASAFFSALLSAFSAALTSARFSSSLSNALI